MEGFKIIDIFGTRAAMYIKGEQTYKTMLGGLITFAYLLIVLVTAIHLSKDMILKKNPTLSTYSQPLMKETVSLGERGFFLGLLYNNELGEAYDFSTQELVLESFIQNAHDSIFSNEKIPVKFIPCKGEMLKSYTDVNLQLRERLIKYGYCFDFTNISLYSTPSYASNSTEFKITFTFNTSKDYSETTIFNLLPGTLTLVSESMSYTPSDYDKPIKRTLISKLFAVTHGEFHISKASIALSRSETDSEWFYSNSKIDSEGLVFEKFSSFYNVMLTDDVGFHFFDFSLNLGEDIYYNKRSYQKIYTLFYELSSTAQIILLFFKFAISLLDDIPLMMYILERSSEARSRYFYDTNSSLQISNITPNKNEKKSLIKKMNNISTLQNRIEFSSSVLSKVKNEKKAEPEPDKNIVNLVEGKDLKSKHFNLFMTAKKKASSIKLLKKYSSIRMDFYNLLVMMNEVSIQKYLILNPEQSAACFYLANNFENMRKLEAKYKASDDIIGSNYFANRMKNEKNMTNLDKKLLAFGNGYVDITSDSQVNEKVLEKSII